jgi:hypothetical protein
LVDELESKNGTIYACEIRGFGYKDLETAEICEEFSGLHGSNSPKIVATAVHKPRIRVISVAH